MFFLISEIINFVYSYFHLVMMAEPKMCSRKYTNMAQSNPFQRNK